MPLRQDLGSSHWSASTNLLAQRFFDQGLRWIVAYNFKKGQKFPVFFLRFILTFGSFQGLESFLQSETLDPKCAMCAWGEAMCRGQNLNVWNLFC